MKVTVTEILERLLPRGTNPSPSEKDIDLGLAKAPTWPPDVFGVAAFLLERSGIYQLMSPGREDRWEKPWFTLSDADVARWKQASEEWRAEFGVPSLVQALWTDLLSQGRSSALSSFPGMGKEAPPWVRTAFALMIIADEASKDVGYVKLDEKPAETSWVNLYDAKAESEWIRRNREKQAASANHVLITRHRYSIALMASEDMLAVQPKARTPQVGATLRTMSQHLALLPAPSRMGATWQRIASSSIDTKRDLNLLLVPFPYKINLEWFSGIRDGTAVSRTSEPHKGWGWFDLEQRWLPEDPATFTQFVSALISEAERDNPGVRVDGVILPEYSVTWEHHVHLVEHLAKFNAEIEFVVSGSRTNCEQSEGNFALTSSINRSRSGDPIIQTNSRGKHHRWRLEKSQIEAYALQDKLDPSVNWWEGIALHRRQVHTHVFRGSSSFTTFICEDLARSDPCHETVRALGPSIVFCLLMDNVQIPVRWPGRYAATLAEDPGSAVLTFTSRGLIACAAESAKASESNRNKGDKAKGTGYARAANWSVGLWRDDMGTEARELHCPPNDHAVLLELEAKQAEDASYDDRRDTEGTSWVYKRSSTVRLTSSHPSLVALEEAKKVKTAG